MTLLALINVIMRWTALEWLGSEFQTHKSLEEGSNEPHDPHLCTSLILFCFHVSYIPIMHGHSQVLN